MNCLALNRNTRRLYRTELPECYRLGDKIPIYNQHGVVIALTWTIDDAATIVRACNCHAELVEVARKLVFAADAKLLSEKHRVVELARAAIRRAEGDV